MGAGSDYTLTSVVLGFDSVDGNENAIIEIWSDDGDTNPLGSLLETLTLSGSLANGSNTFTSSGLTLSASTTYWVAVRGGNTNTFNWLGGTDQSVTSDIGATHNKRIYALSGQGGDPATWSGVSGVLNQIQVNAVAAVPEPSIMMMLCMPAFLLLLRRRRQIA